MAPLEVGNSHVPRKSHPDVQCSSENAVSRPFPLEHADQKLTVSCRNRISVRSRQHSLEDGEDLSLKVDAKRATLVRVNE